MKVFQLILPEKDTYILEVTGWKEEKKMDFTLSLKLHNVFFHLYNLGVGILIFYLENDPDDTDLKHTPKNLQEYISFLDLARRMYPPFVAGDYHRPIKRETKNLNSINNNKY